MFNPDCTSNLSAKRIDYINHFVVNTQHSVKIYSPEAQDIENIVCDVMGISKTMFYSNRRTRAAVYARKAYIYIMRTYGNNTACAIGEKLNRDHTTVISHSKSFFDWLRDPEFNAKIKVISSRLSRYGWSLYDDVMELA